MSRLFDIAERLELGPFFAGLVCSWRYPGRVLLVPMHPPLRDPALSPPPGSSAAKRMAIQRGEDPYRQGDDVAAGIVRPAHVRPRR